MNVKGNEEQVISNDLPDHSQGYLEKSKTNTINSNIINNPQANRQMKLVKLATCPALIWSKLKVPVEFDVVDVLNILKPA